MYSETAFVSLFPNFFVCLPSPEFQNELRTPTNISEYDFLNRGIRGQSFEQLKHWPRSPD